MEFLSVLEPWLAAHGFSRLPHLSDAPDEAAFVNADGAEVVVYEDGATMYGADYRHTRAVVMRDGVVYRYGSLGGYLAVEFEKAALAATKG
jgi:hypothetical protein